MVLGGYTAYLSLLPLIRLTNSLVRLGIRHSDWRKEFRQP